MRNLPTAVALMLFCSAASAAPTYEEAVAPLLRTTCLGCHNDTEPESGFSVETFEKVLLGGDSQAAILVPGNPEASLLLQRMESTGDDHMPPQDHPQPNEADVQGLREWIAAGAPPPQVDRPLSMGLVVPKLPGFSGRMPVTALAYTNDRTRLAVARGRSVEVVPVGSDGLPQTDAPAAAIVLADLPGKVTAVHFSSDDRRLVIAGGIPGARGQADIRDASTGNLIQAFPPHRDLLYDAELSPDGLQLATAGYDGVIRIWNAADASMLREIDVHNAAVFDLAWHPEGGLLASASGDETVKLWRTSDGQRLDTLSQPQGEVRRVLFTRTGDEVIAAGRDKRIHVWRLASQTEPTINPQVHARFAHESPITTLALAEDGGHLLSAAEDGSLTSWSLPALESDLTNTAQPDLVSVIIPWQGSQFLVGRMDGTLAIVDGSGTGDVVTLSIAAGGGVASTEMLPGEAVVHTEAEPNDTAETAARVTLPARLTGSMQRAGDADCFRFAAKAGQRLLFEVNAARSKSQLDSRIELLDGAGQPVPQVRLQAVRDSWFTFRGKDSTQSGDFRLHNWREMELDQYLYAGGEVARLWLYPRGPDSGFLVYPGFGQRETFFHTTAVTHALGEPAWIVKPLPPSTTAVANGLPVFDIPYENDDDPQGRLGTDSQLIAEIPADGDYVIRIRDTRGFGATTAADADAYRYTLDIRSPRPSFTVAVGGVDAKVSPGSGREISFTATRLEGFDGPIEVDVEQLPAGFHFHGPVQIEAGQRRAFGVLSATSDAVDPDDTADKAVKVVARAAEPSMPAADEANVLELGTLGNLQLGPAPKLTVAITHTTPSDLGEADVANALPHFTIHPGETITARVIATRHDFAPRISFGNEDSGRNLPYAVFVDNIGLNGLMIVEGQTEREFFITASPVARPGRRLFHLRASDDGGQCSLPAVLEVLP